MSIVISGTDGITMASDDSLSFGDVAINRDNVGGRKNAIINGGFDVWQRGSSFSGLYTADRWFISGTTLVNENETGSPTGFRRNAYINRSVAGTASVHQRIESTNAVRLQGEQVTVSFEHVAAIGAVDSITVVLSFPTVSDTFGAINLIQSVAVADLTDGRKSVTFDALPADVNKGLELRIDYVVSGDVTWRLTGVQLEAGSQATPFEQRSYGEELALCQRYYYEQTISTYLLNYGTSTNNSLLQFYHPVVMRAAPTSSFAGVANASGVSVSGTTPERTLLLGTATNASAPRVDQLFVDAEL